MTAVRGRRLMPEPRPVHPVEWVDAKEVARERKSARVTAALNVAMVILVGLFVASFATGQYLRMGPGDREWFLSTTVPFAVLSAICAAVGVHEHQKASKAR